MPNPEIVRELIDGEWTTTYDTGGGNGGSGEILTTTVDISSAEILAMHTTAVEIAAAPGAGVALIPFIMAVNYEFVTTPYSAEGTIDLRYDGMGFNFESFGAGLDQAADWSNFGTNFAGGVARASAEDKALVAKLLAQVTTGDGTLKVTLWYTAFTY